MANKEEQIDEMAKDLRALDCLQYNPNYTASYQRAVGLHSLGYRKASEIFEEIEEIRLRQIRKSEFFRNGSTEEMERKFYEGAEWGLRQLSHWFAELKKKYTQDKGRDKIAEFGKYSPYSWRNTEEGE